MNRYKVIDTTDDRFVGSIIELDLNAIVNGAPVVIKDVEFYATSIIIKGLYTTIACSNYVIMLKKVG